MDALLRRRMMMATLGGSPTPPEPPVVEPVFYDRLIFDGTAYIVTDIVPPTDFSIRISNLGNETLKAQQRVVMCTATVGNIGFIMNSNTNSTNRRFSVYYAASAALIAGTTASYTFSNATGTYWLTPKRFGRGSSSSSFTKGSGVPNGYLHIGQNPTLTGQPFTGTMDMVRIYDSTAQNATSAADLLTYTPLYTLQPCTYNGEAGLWNVEEGKFYGNSAGSGQLSVTNVN